MAAYAAVVSLHHTINVLLLNSSSVSSSTREILELAEKEASSLLQVLEGLNSSNRSRRSMERVDALEGQIRDSAHKLEDVLEFHELKQQEEKEGEDGDEGAMVQEIRTFCEAAKRLEEEYLADTGIVASEACVENVREDGEPGHVVCDTREKIREDGDDEARSSRPKRQVREPKRLEGFIRYR